MMLQVSRCQQETRTVFPRCQPQEKKLMLLLSPLLLPCASHPLSIACQSVSVVCVKHVGLVVTALILKDTLRGDILPQAWTPLHMPVGRVIQHLVHPFLRLECANKAMVLCVCGHAGQRHHGGGRKVNDCCHMKTVQHLLPILEAFALEHLALAICQEPSSLGFSAKP